MPSNPFTALRAPVCLLVLVIVAAAPVAAQDNGTRPRVFFDCDGRDCNSQYYRTEIGWLDWVNDRQVADVHLIMASTQTGAGGREYQLDFIGVNAYADYADQMLYQSLPTDTDVERLDAITDVLSVGMARFAVLSGFRGLTEVQGGPGGPGGPGQGVVSAQEVDDPWNLWVFRVNSRANINGEANSRRQNYFGSFNASRVTPTWKLNFNSNVSYNEQEFELEEGTFISTQTNWGIRPYVVYALAEHWSAGVRGEVARQTRFNQRFRWEVTPTIEYSFFPYQDATRRALTASYRIGPAHREYFERTLFGVDEETRWEHAVEIDLDARQPWGEAGASIQASSFILMPDRPEYEEGLYALELRGDIDFRIFRGFSISLNGDVGWVQDQIYLSAEGISDEERLLELEQQETDFQYGFSVGFNIQFGSIFNNVVNNRFRNAQGFGGRFF